MAEEEKKLAYREIPQALWVVVKILWRVSPPFVLLTIFQQLKDRIIPFILLFITAAVTSRLPALINDASQLPSILVFIAAGVALEIISRLLDLSTQQFSTRTEAQVTITMREFFYQRYAALPYHLYEDKNVIDAFNYADEFMYRFSQFGMRQIARTLGNVLELIATFIALIAVAWYLPILLLFFLPLFLRSIIRLNREQMKAYRQNRPDNRRIWAIESLFYPRKIKETRLYGVVEHFLVERRKLTKSTKERELRVEFRQNKMSLIQDVQVQAAGLFASSIALWRIAYQGAPLGIFVLAQQLTSRAGSAVQSLFSEFSSFDRDLYGFAEYQYITETLQDTKPDKPVLAKEAFPHIKVNDVSFRYPESKRPVLTKLTLDLPFGSSLAIVGENGAGKTTLTRLLLGLYQPESGSITANDTPLSELDNASWLRQIGVLLQDFGINEDITIREAIWLGDISKPKDDELIWQALDQAELKQTIEDLPFQLGTYLGKWIDKEKGTELSGGQLQRLAIARALFRDPAILILDEPTSAVDANAEERIFNHLHGMREGKTTIYISHRFSTVRRAEHIVFMHKGKITESGTHEELMKLKGRYHEMFTKQSKGYQ